MASPRNSEGAATDGAGAATMDRAGGATPSGAGGRGAKLAGRVTDGKSPGQDLLPEDEGGQGFRQRRSGVAAWVLYDLANTLFSFVVLSFYFGPWLVSDLDARDSSYTVPQSLSMLVVLLVAPLLGAVTDRTRRMPLLAASTLLAVACTMLLGSGQLLGLERDATLALAVGFFVMGNIGFQLGLVFYDALLPAVSSPTTIGRIGALGVGVGYLGSLVGLAIGTLTLQRDPDGQPVLFLLTGLSFLLFAFPCFFLVREPRRPRRGNGTLLRDALGGVIATLRSLPRERRLARFLVARVLYADAVNTLILILGIYAVSEAGFREETLAYSLLLGLGIIFAVLSAPLWGRAVDRWGPKHTLDAVLLLWSLTLAVTVVHPLLGLPREVFFIIGGLVGTCLAGTWSADRPLLVGLSPPAKVGEWFGLYAMAGRFAAVMGPLLWALTVDVAFRDRPIARPMGVLVLLAMMLASYGVLRGLEDPRRPRSPFGRFLPWREGIGRDARPLWRLPLAAPGITLYLVATWALFLPFSEPVTAGEGFRAVPQEFLRPWAYEIPELLGNFPLVLLALFTAPFVNAHLVQLVYVTLLLALFGAPFEVREGTRRTAIVFFAATLAGGIVAGLALHALYPGVSDHPALADAWGLLWTGGSAGAFGLMGGYAARARDPVPLLVAFAVWELNVGWWFLRSWTPAFHVTALATGFVLTRWALRPSNAPAARADAV